MALTVSEGLDQGSSSSKKGSTSVYIDIETIRLHASSFIARVTSRVSVETIRPLPVFLGVNPVGFCLSAGAFTPPVSKVDKGTPEKIKNRVKLNFAFFLSNYALIAGMVGIVVALMHPGMLLTAAGVYSLWGLHSFMIRNELILFGIHLHSLLTIQQRFYTLFVITTIAVIMKALAPAFYFVGISGLIILLHAFLRDPKHIESMSDLMGADDSDDEADSGGSNESGVVVERRDAV